MTPLKRLTTMGNLLTFKTYAKKAVDGPLLSSPLANHNKATSDSNVIIVTVKSDTGVLLAENNGSETKRFWKEDKEVKNVVVQLCAKSKKVDENKLYTVLALDGDAPTSTVNFLSDIVHGLWCDVPATEASKAIENFAIMDYSPPGPPRGSHTYSFFVYEQPKGQLRSRMKEDKALAALNSGLWPRIGFGTEKFVNKYGLELCAFTYFEASANPTSDK